MESAEHVWIGDHISLQFPDHTPSPGKHPAYSVVLDEIGSVQLTYGRIIALAGDFFGVLGGQICRADDHEAAFRKAWETLARADAGELANIVSIMEEEIRALDAVLRTRKREPHEMYDELGDELSQRWNGVTGGSSDYWVPAGRYLKLAAENFDHFGHGAETAYRAGHVVAMKEAAAAAKLSGSAAYAGLVRAYAMNAFADHFLTDLFSAGHLRVPRQELFDVTNTYWDAGHVTGVGAYISGLLVKGMHDEDSKYGLTVENALGDHWTAYGDKYLLDLKSRKNCELVTKAAQASADDVWNAYQGHSHSFEALKVSPNLSILADTLRKDGDKYVNSSPAFKMQDGSLCERSPLADRARYAWDSIYDSVATIIYFRNRSDPPEHTFFPAPCFTVGNGDPSSRTFVGWLCSDTWGNVHVTTKESDAHRVCWVIEEAGLLLRKQTDGTNGRDRWLGLGDRNYASWGLRPGSYWGAVYYHPDGTISLKKDGHPSGRKLFYDNDDRLSWTQEGAAANPNIVTVQVPLPEGPYF
ncbi:MAG TPA: hypothetical protein VIT41_16715 [Microlunatus sp.]